MVEEIKSDGENRRHETDKERQCKIKRYEAGRRVGLSPSGVYESVVQLCRTRV